MAVEFGKDRMKRSVKAGWRGIHDRKRDQSWNESLKPRPGGQLTPEPSVALSGI